MRLFIAIKFPPAVTQELYAWEQSLQREIPDPERRLHWVKENQLHMTLKFLGETREDRLPRLEQVLLTTASLHGRFDLSLAKAGHFGGRVIWLGLDSGSLNVAKLAESIEMACEALGFVRENRHFHPHITLARSKINPGTIHLSQISPAIAQKTFGPFKVEEFFLIRSTLTPGGSIYAELGRFAMRPG